MLKAHKKAGQTPLELLNQLRQERQELQDETLSYAGRLDPIAEGEMLIIVGPEENKNRQQFLKYDKTYEADILFGFATDTYDVMGLIQDYFGLDLNKQSESNIFDDSKLNSKNLKKVLKKIQKIQKLPYPAFSSKTVGGKPLFEWYKEGRISEIEIPETKIEVKKVKLLQTSEISGPDLWNYLNFIINEVSGDFRQKEILDNWYQTLKSEDSAYRIAKVKFKVSSGTYIRSLACEIGQEIGVPACLLRLKRTRIHN